VEAESNSGTGVVVAEAIGLFEELREFGRDIIP
jgi:hypothetical protein